MSNSLGYPYAACRCRTLDCLVKTPCKTPRCQKFQLLYRAGVCRTCKSPNKPWCPEVLSTQAGYVLFLIKDGPDHMHFLKPRTSLIAQVHFGLCPSQSIQYLLILRNSRSTTWSSSGNTSVRDSQYVEGDDHIFRSETSARISDPPAQCSTVVCC